MCAGPQYANRIVELLDQADAAQVVATDPAEVLEDITVPRRESQITAWVNAIYGCNEKCTYCVVPFTRCVVPAPPACTAPSVRQTPGSV